MSFSFRDPEKLFFYSIPVIVFGIAFCLLLVQSEDPRLRFAGANFKPLFLPPTRVDIVFMGTSRMRRAVFTPFFDQIHGRQNPGGVIWDAAFPGSGMGAEVTYLEEMIERHDVRRIYLHYFASNKPNKQAPHRFFAKYARLDDLMLSPLPGLDVFTKTQIRSAMLFEKLDHTLIELLRSRPEPSGFTEDRLYDDSLPREVRVLESDRQLKRILVKQKKSKKTARAWKHSGGWNERNRYFVKRLIDLARERGIEVVLVDVPKIYHLPLGDKHMQRIQREFEVPYVSLYPAIDKTTDYGDKGHLNIRGASKIAPYLLGLD